MVAVAQYIPTDPEEKESVLAVLREHPELQGFITRATAKAEEVFPEVRITLDAVRYDEWDPPTRLTVFARDHDLGAFMAGYFRFTGWLIEEGDYPQDINQVLLIWDGPLGADR